MSHMKGVYTCIPYLSGIAVDILLEERDSKLADVTEGLLWQGTFGSGSRLLH